MTSLVMIKKVKNEELLVTTSNIIASKTDNNHDSVQKLIKKHIDSLEIFGKVGFEIRPLESGQKENVYYLNEHQFTLLVTFMKNNEIVTKLKIELIKEFFRMREHIREKQSIEWQQARLQSKTFHKELTDVIKNFIEYAKGQGSKSPNMYYIHFAKLINKALGINANEIDSSNQITLRNKAILIEVIEKELVDNMNNKMFYKEIFKSCKIKVEQLINFIPSLNKKED